MALIEWTEDLNTGIRVIDNQHQRIIEYINKLGHAQQSQNRDEVSEILDELVDYTLTHFAFEESLMEESGYAYFDAHKKVHQLFVKRIADYQQRFKLNEDIAEELGNTLRAWLINHIKRDDKEYCMDVLKHVQRSSTEGQRKGWFKRRLSRFFS
jgi:hemerythrin